MTANDSRSFSAGDTSTGHRTTAGWTRLHSWIFLVIVAVALLLLVMQNRYHYFSPQGVGKAYRVDKLFGSVQEFDPTVGWMSARLTSSVPTPATGTMEPPSVVSSVAESETVTEPQPETPMPPPVESTVPESEPAKESAVQERADLTEEPPTPPVTEESVSQEAAQPQPEPEPPQQQELTTRERFQLFKQAFPEFGEEEFQLANEDLYPDWKIRVNPDGTWPEFVGVYKEFIQWWIDSGSPPESGFELWKRFMATKQ
jgi:hypothetical protein